MACVVMFVVMPARHCRCRDAANGERRTARVKRRGAVRASAARRAALSCAAGVQSPYVGAAGRRRGDRDGATGPPRFGR